MLEVHDLHVSYGKVEAVRGISVSAASGKVTLVLGANGAGKTTMLRAISGLLRARSGSISLDGADLTRRSPTQIVKQGLVMVPEGRKVFAPLSVEENLRLGGYTVGRADRQAATDRVYSLFPILKDRRKGAAGLLSGGEQQMLAFGRAMMSQPKMMLMDEPSMGLAPAVIDTIMVTAREIADSGIGVLMVEQNAEVGLAVADDVVVVSRGEVAFSGRAAEARENHSVMLAFLGEAALSSS